MAFNLVGYKNVTVVEATAPNVLEAGGQALTDNFKELADETYLHHNEETSDPTVNDDSADGYVAGSLWINITSGDFFYCVDNTTGAADWQQVGTDTSGGGPGVTDHGALTGLLDDDHPQYMMDVIDDSSPQLGGDLDVLTRKIFSSVANQDMVVEANGTAAFQTSSVGTARGAYAVDLQTRRSSAGQVATGTNSAIVGGQDNMAYNNYGLVFGLQNNIYNGTTYSANVSTITGGQLNQIGISTATANVDYSFIGGGIRNKIRNNDVATHSEASSIVGGQQNLIEGYATQSVIAGGGYNTIDNRADDAAYCIIGSGLFNRIGSDTTTDSAGYSVICGGRLNQVSTRRAFVGAGFQNNIHENTFYSSIVGGGYNEIRGTSYYAFIGGGRSNTISNSTSFASHYCIIGGGRYNRIGSETSAGNVTHATIAGGDLNIIEEASNFCSIGGGRSNKIRKTSSGTISGGAENIIIANAVAQCHRSVISGGLRNRIGDQTTTSASSYNCIGGGRDNYAVLQYNVIGGGRQVSLYGLYNFMGGGFAQVAIGDYNVICGGVNHRITATNSFVGSGNANIIRDTNSASYSAIVGGSAHRVGSDSVTTGTVVGSFIGGGTNNKIFNQDDVNAAYFSSIVGGASNSIMGTAKYSAIGGGTGNWIWSGPAGRGYHVIAGGRENVIANDIYNAIGGGYGNYVSGTSNTIAGGDSGVINASSQSFIGGGYKNTIIGDQNTIGGGFTNQITDQTGNVTQSTIAGGAGNSIGDFNIGLADVEEGTIGGGDGNRISNPFSAVPFYGGTISGGRANTIWGDPHFSFIGGGTDNYVGSSSAAYGCAVIAGGRNNVILNGEHSSISGGYKNTITANQSVIAGGDANTISGGGAGNSIGGGNTNTISSGGAALTIAGGFTNTIAGGSYNFIGGGLNNYVNSNRSAICAGDSSICYGSYSGIVAGHKNYLSGSGDWSFIGAGQDNSITGSRSAIVSGDSGICFGSYSGIVAGRRNYIGATGDLSFIGAGEDNYITGSFSAIVSGDSSKLVGNYNFVGGGANHWIENVTSGYNTIGGGEINRITDQTGNVTLSTIAGGTGNSIGDYQIGLADIEEGTIGGGNGNRISNPFSAVTFYGGTIPGGRSNTIWGDPHFSFIGGGTLNYVGSSSALYGCAVIAGGRNNAILNGEHSSISGGYYNRVGASFLGAGYTGTGTPDYSVIAGGTVNTITNPYNASASEASAIGGGSQNFILGWAFHSVISGGRLNVIKGATAGNAHSAWCTIGGGIRNKIGGDTTDAGGGWSFGNTISGGSQNIIRCDSALQNARYNFIGGGNQNSILGSAEYNAIVGGSENKIDNGGVSSDGNFIGAGIGNRIGMDTSPGHAYYSGHRHNTISGGYYNKIASSLDEQAGCVIAGGWKNEILENTSTGSIGGGNRNIIYADSAGGICTIAGGGLNTIGARRDYNTGPNSGLVQHSVVWDWGHVIGGGQWNTICATHNPYPAGENVELTCAVVAGGFRNEILGTGTDFGVISGGRQNVINNSASTTGAYCGIGGGYLNRVGSDTANNRYPGYSFIAGGYRNEILSRWSFIGNGNSNKIGVGSGTSFDSEEYSVICGGSENRTFAKYCFVGSGASNDVYAQYSAVVNGGGCKTTLYGQIVQGTSPFGGVRGSNQTSVVVLSSTTSDAAATEMFLDAGTMTERITLEDDDAWAFNIQIIGQGRTGTDINKVNQYFACGAIRRIGVNTAMVGSFTTLSSIEEQAAWAFNITADNTNDSLKVEVTGTATNTVRWVARVELVQVRIT